MITKQQTARLLNQIAHRQGVTITEAKIIVKNSTREELEDLSINLEAERFMPSVYQVIKILNDVDVILRGLGVQSYINRRDKIGDQLSAPALRVKGSDITVIYFSKSRTYKVYHHGGCVAESKFPSMMANIVCELLN